MKGDLIVHRLTHPIEGVLPTPPSKYHTHRALILGSLAEGDSFVTGVSKSLDNMSTVRCLSLLGAEFVQTPAGYTVHGRKSFVTPPDILDAGNSGSTIHFLAGVAANQPGTAVFTGDASLRSRPIGPLLQALNDWGVECWSTRANGCLPAVIKGRDLSGLASSVSINGEISPWATGLVLLAPFTGKDATVRLTGKRNESSYTLLMISMMKDFGVRVEIAPDRMSYFIPGGQSYRAASAHIPGDIALASFGLVLAALSGSRLKYTGLDLAVMHPEAKILEVLQEMGADVRIDPAAQTVEVVGGRRLKGVTVDCNDSPDMVPILSVLLAMAEGQSAIVNSPQLRYKECDRLAAMLQLNKMGAKVTETADGLTFDGVQQLHGADIQSFSDHRVLMAFAVAGCLAEGETVVSDAAAAAVSYPGFLKDMQRLGVGMTLAE